MACCRSEAPSPCAAASASGRPTTTPAQSRRSTCLRGSCAAPTKPPPWPRAHRAGPVDASCAQARTGAVTRRGVARLPPPNACRTQACHTRFTRRSRHHPHAPRIASGVRPQVGRAARTLTDAMITLCASSRALSAVFMFNASSSTRHGKVFFSLMTSKNHIQSRVHKGAATVSPAPSTCKTPPGERRGADRSVRCRDAAGSFATAGGRASVRATGRERC